MVLTVEEHTRRRGCVMTRALFAVAALLLIAAVAVDHWPREKPRPSFPIASRNIIARIDLSGSATRTDDCVKREQFRGCLWNVFSAAAIRASDRDRDWLDRAGRSRVEYRRCTWATFCARDRDLMFSVAGDFLIVERDVEAKTLHVYPQGRAALPPHKPTTPCPNC